eukprot:349751-Chlamydomonas_euryale.AAC.8
MDGLQPPTVPTLPHILPPFHISPPQIEWTVVSDAKPTDKQLQDIKFAWRAVKHVKSNAITVAKDGKLLGMGSGQPNRVNRGASPITIAKDRKLLGTVFGQPNRANRCVRESLDGLGASPMPSPSLRTGSCWAWARGSPTASTGVREYVGGGTSPTPSPSPRTGSCWAWVRGSPTPPTGVGNLRGRGIRAGVVPPPPNSSGLEGKCLCHTLCHTLSHSPSLSVTLSVTLDRLVALG